MKQENVNEKLDNALKEYLPVQLGETLQKRFKELEEKEKELDNKTKELSKLSEKHGKLEQAYELKREELISCRKREEDILTREEEVSDREKRIDLQISEIKLNCAESRIEEIKDLVGQIFKPSVLKRTVSLSGETIIGGYDKDQYGNATPKNIATGGKHGSEIEEEL